MISVFFVPGAPIALFLLLVVWMLRRERKRRAGWRALATKYGLETEPRSQIAPDPDIRGLLMPAVSSRYMQGRIDGVPVVAFDYRIGGGRGSKNGSCAGVKRPGFNVLPPRFAPVLKHEGEWTFAHSDYAWWWRGRLLTADEIEQIWNVLLHTPGPDGRAAKSNEVPGGVVIRPAKMGLTR